MAERDQDLLKFYCSEIQWQSGLLSGRLNAFIASQSFLVIAYATAISSLVGNWKNPFALLFPPFLGMLALVLIFQAWPGIRSAYAELKGWQECQDRLLFDRQELGDYDLYLDERRAENATAYPGAAWKYFRQGVLFPRHAPWVFLFVWCYLTLLPWGLFLFC
ncbi:hypothetical protein AAH678_14080 [Sodalis endosymbiont of Spalangia cameroni]|uniref:hypothetical protein n=1 Tax=Sodalis praecaptivus TaxID=1239307 RepID=UPI0031F81E50